MTPKLYMIPYSQPVRAVLMTLKALDLKVELIEVNLLDKQQLKPEFLKLNPQHSVPTFVDDDGFTIWDSHAIMAYIVDKYGKNDALYPKNIKLRAVINQRLHFESGILFPRTMAIIRPIIYQGSKSIEPEKIEMVHEAYEFLESFLESGDWVAGNSMTIADFSVVPSISTLDVVVPIDPEVYPNIVRWMKKMETVPCYEPNKIGCEHIKAVIKEKLGS